MISFEEALKIVEKNTLPLKTEKISTAWAVGCVCAKDVKSPVPLPLFDNSAMDGFLLRSTDTESAAPTAPVFLKITQVLKAGDTAGAPLPKNEAFRIMTGARVANGGDSVLTLESATVRGENLVLHAPVRQGEHIRRKAEEIKKNEIVLARGTVINPGTIGFLASMGLNEVDVYKKPRVSLIATGSELAPPGSPLSPGKIYDSNTSMLKAALEEMRLHRRAQTAA